MVKMRPSFSVFMTIILALFSCIRTDHKATEISGTIHNSAVSSVSIEYFNEPIEFEYLTKASELDENNKFALLLDISKPKLVTFIYQNIKTDIFIQPGQKVMLDAQGDNFESSLQFSGSGIDNNNFLRKLRNTFPKGPALPTNQVSADPYTLFDEKGQNLGSFIDQGKRKYKLTKDFIDLINIEAQYEQAYNKLSYSPTHYWVNGEKKGRVNPHDFEVLNEIDLNNDRALALGSFQYRSFLSKYIYRVYHYSMVTNFEKVMKEKRALRQNPTNKKSTDSIQNEISDNKIGWATGGKYNIAKQELSGKTLQYFLAHQIAWGYERGDIELTDKLFDDFKVSSGNQEYMEYLSEYRKKALKIAEGKMAPDFTAMNEDGNMVSLSDFRGQVVLLYFWTSWCGPCQSALTNYLPRYEEYFEESNVVFLKVSLDENQSAWIKAIREIAIKGINVNASGFSAPVAKDYNIRAVPSCFLIDKNGVIVDRPNIKIPSEVNKILDQIESLL